MGNEYSIQEINEYIQSKAEDNKTNFCYIEKETKKEIIIKFGLNPKIKEVC